MVPHVHNFLLPRCKASLVPHIDAMVITVHIDRCDITKILIDNGSQAEIREVVYPVSLGTRITLALSS
jgi:hypothetical protein